MPIFDQGYQHWSGHLSSDAWRWFAITRRGVRTALQGRLVRTALILVPRPQCHPVSARAHAGRASPDDRDWVIAFVLLTGTQTAFVLFFPLVITVLALGHGA